MPVRIAQSPDGFIQSLSAKKGWWLEFRYLSSKAEGVAFHGFVTQFTDTFTPSWNDEDVFGRMDSISIFKNTRRNMNIAFDVPAHSIGEAKDNLIAVGRLMQYAYPVYRTINSSAGKIPTKAKESIKTKKMFGGDLVRQVEQETANVRPSNNRVYMTSSPLLMFKFANLASNHATTPTNFGSPMLTDGDGGYRITGGSLNSIPTISANLLNHGRNGLICKFNGTVQATPDFELGVFGDEPFAIYPKLWKVSIPLTIFHTHLPGWIESGNDLAFSDNSSLSEYPWGVKNNLGNGGR